MPSILNATTSSGLVTSADNSGSLQLATNNGTTAVTINTSQNVGIGTTSLAGATKVTIKQSSTVGLAILSNSNDAGVYLWNDGTKSIIGSSYELSAGYTPLTFETNNTERMRIDTSGNLQFNSGYGSVATAYGCRAWVNFNGTGTVAIRASGNVSSITDNGTGTYTANFTTALPDGNYATEVLCNVNINALGWAMLITNAPTTTAVSVRTFNQSLVATDCEFVNIAIFR